MSFSLLVCADRSLTSLVADLIAGVDFPAQELAIRELINQEAPLRTVLRLLCLYSIISAGLKPKVLEEFKREILQVRPGRHSTFARTSRFTAHSDVRLPTPAPPTLPLDALPPRPSTRAAATEIALPARAQAAAARRRRRGRERSDGPRLRLLGLRAAVGPARAVRDWEGRAGLEGHRRGRQGAPGGDVRGCAGRRRRSLLKWVLLFSRKCSGI